VGRCDGAGVVPGVNNGGRVELYVRADEGISEWVSVGVRWRSCSADQSANDIHRGLSGRQIPKTLVSRGGRDARVFPNAFVTSCSRWAVTSKSNLRESGASRVLDHLLLARALLPLTLVVLPSTRRALQLYVLVGIDSSVSVDRRILFCKPSIASQGRTEHGARSSRWWGVVWLLVDELVDPELELTLPTVMRPFCRHDIRFLFCLTNHSSISTWMVATIGASRLGGGGDEWRASTWTARQTT
jgi:hypothetical protein